MPPAPRCLLLGHGAQLDRPLGMSTRDWLPPKIYTALQMWMLLTFFLPVHPEQDPHHPSLPRASTTSPPTEGAEKPGMMDAKSRRAPGPKPFYMSSFLTDARGALVTPFRLAPTVCVTCLPVGRLPAVNLGCIPGPTQRTSWRWRLARRQRGKPRWALGSL